jgi:hypothetical protein
LSFRRFERTPVLASTTRPRIPINHYSSRITHRQICKRSTSFSRLGSGATSPRAARADSHIRSAAEVRAEHRDATEELRT